MRTLVTALGIALLAAGTTVPTASDAQAATAYRYWAYYTASGPAASGGAWTYSQRGPATDYPSDGDVQGWRFAIQVDAGQGLSPRIAPDFDALCAGTPARTDRIRVGIVVDFGLAADAPAGENPPHATPAEGCVSVPDGASGVAVLDAAVGAGAVRIGTGADSGLICGIAGYPKTECAPAVKVHPTPVATPIATPAATPHANPARTPARSPSPTTPPMSAVATPSSANGSAGSSRTTPASPPSSSGTSAATRDLPAVSGSPVLLGSSTVVAHHRGRGLLRALLGVLLVVVIGAAAAWNSSRPRRRRS